MASWQPLTPPGAPSSARFGSAWPPRCWGSRSAPACTPERSRWRSTTSAGWPCTSPRGSWTWRGPARGWGPPPLPPRAAAPPQSRRSARHLAWRHETTRAANPVGGHRPPCPDRRRQQQRSGRHPRRCLSRLLDGAQVSVATGLSRVVSTRPTGRTLIILAATLVVYQNIVTVITGGELFTSGPVALTISAILIAAMLLWARQSNLTLVELGITRHGAARGAAIGVGVAAAVAVAALVLLRSGLLVPGPVHYAPFAEMTVAHVVFRALILMPLATILPE